MPRRFARGNRDKNEPSITEYLRRANVRYCQLPEGAGADLLLYLAPMMLIEIKNPDVPKSERQPTELEAYTQVHCMDMGIPYHIVETPEEMATIVNAWIAGAYK